MITKERMEGIIIGIIAAAFVTFGFVIYELNSSGSTQLQAQAVTEANTADIAAQRAAESIAPKGIPEIYGEELGVSYDDVSLNDQKKADETIRKLGNLDVKIRLSSEEQARYIRIASMISCEYCCGADSIIFANGEPACSCAHSYAMRGVAKYLIQQHGSEFTDDEILEEMAKWKTLFFPGQISKKAEILRERGIELSYTNIASNKYRGI